MVKTFPDGHFYSPIPDTDSILSNKFKDQFDGALLINNSQLEVDAKAVFSFSSELTSLVDSNSTRFEWNNDQFPPADAFAYYGMLRQLKPKKILEIGSGFSTQVAIEAVKKNEVGTITCIEPYPRDLLKENTQITLIESILQDVGDDIFSSLDAGDILFIDSSHQVKCQSDVLDIFFRVLDLIKPGVFIHVHDIFFPDDYPEIWLKENGVFFNEQYFLLAFLKDNLKYRVCHPNAYIVRKKRDFYEAIMLNNHINGDDSFVNPIHGFIKAGSFWIEKTG